MIVPPLAVEAGAAVEEAVDGVAGVDMMVVLADAVAAFALADAVDIEVAAVGVEVWVWV